MAERDHQQFLIADIMPAHEVHLLAGPSGVGKTTGTCQWILTDFRNGAPVFGKPVFTCPVAYVSCDRSPASFMRSLDHHGLAHDLFPWEVLRRIPPTDKSRLGSVLRWAKSQIGHGLVIIDGFGTLVPEGALNDYSTVAQFLTDAQFLCQAFDLTVLGTVHATKVKMQEGFPNPRQRILGSAAWAGYSDTIVVMDPEDPEDVSNLVRVVSVLPRGAAEFSFKVENVNGRLVPVDLDADADSVIYSELDKLPSEGPFSKSDLYEKVWQAAVELGADSYRQFERWLGRTVECGRLRRIGKANQTRYFRIKLA